MTRSAVPSPQGSSGSRARVCYLKSCLEELFPCIACRSCTWLTLQRAFHGPRAAPVRRRQCPAQCGGSPGPQGAVREGAEKGQRAESKGMPPTERLNQRQGLREKLQAFLSDDYLVVMADLGCSIAADATKPCSAWTCNQASRPGSVSALSHAANEDWTTFLEQRALCGVGGWDWKLLTGLWWQASLLSRAQGAMRA